MCSSDLWAWSIAATASPWVADSAWATPLPAELPGEQTQKRTSEA